MTRPTLLNQLRMYSYALASSYENVDTIWIRLRAQQGYGASQCHLLLLFMRPYFLQHEILLQRYTGNNSREYLLFAV